jgi:hypothetical protein
MMNMRGLRKPDSRVALDFIEAEVRLTHIDAQISMLSPSKVPTNEITSKKENTRGLQ